MLHFPKGFRWGSATAAHQIEGNNVNSDWWARDTKPFSGSIRAHSSENRYVPRPTSARTCMSSR